MSKQTREELAAAFEQWHQDHGVVWFDTDVRLAEAIAAELGIKLVWNEDRVVRS
jgi:hypothetical protein